MATGPKHAATGNSPGGPCLPGIFFGLDHVMYMFDYIALGSAVASAMSLFAAFVFGWLATVMATHKMGPDRA